MREPEGERDGDGGGGAGVAADTEFILREAIEVKIKSFAKTTRRRRNWRSQTTSCHRGANRAKRPVRNSTCLSKRQGAMMGPRRQRPGERHSPLLTPRWKLKAFRAKWTARAGKSRAKIKLSANRRIVRGKVRATSLDEQHPCGLRTVKRNSRSVDCVFEDQAPAEDHCVYDARSDLGRIKRCKMTAATGDGFGEERRNKGHKRSRRSKQRICPKARYYVVNDVSVGVKEAAGVWHL